LVRPATAVRVQVFAAIAFRSDAAGFSDIVKRRFVRMPRAICSRHVEVDPQS
jgi:hypothetical protein